MLNIRATIDSLLDTVASSWEKGDYRRSYLFSRNALGILGKTSVDRETTCRILISCAKSAYYMSRFEECEGYLRRTLSSLGQEDGGFERELRSEVAILEANISRRRGDYTGALERVEKVDPGDDKSLMIRKMMVEGVCLMRIGESEKALKVLEGALGVASHSSDDRARAAVLASIGLIHLDRGLFNPASDYFKRSMEAYGKVGDDYGRAAAALNSGIVEYRLGRFSESARLIEFAVKGFEGCGWQLGVCRSMIAMGNVERYRGHLKEALELYESARESAMKKGFLREKSMSEGCIGRANFMLKDYEKAERWYQAGLDTASPDSDTNLQISRYIAELYSVTGKRGKAECYYSMALEMAEKLKAGRDKGLLYAEMAKAEFSQGDPRKGRELMDESLGILRASGCRMDLAATQLEYARKLMDVYGSRLESNSSNDPDSWKIAERLWTLLVESGHLAGGTDAVQIKREADEFLERVYRLRRRAPRIEERARKEGSFVKLDYSPDYILHDNIVSISKDMFDIYEQAKFAASSSSHVLITGETGTGKELIARLIHDLSDRANRKFIAVNCSAIPERLFESELFGHRKGCFTGASEDRRGLFEEARGGSIFLDEIGELTEIQQVKLLRVIQEKKVRRIGENVERELDVRLISATNREIDDIDLGSSMREDFYYRINEERIHLSPLRERKEDIVPLLAHCLCSNGNGGSKGVLIEKKALECIRDYPWPGNVRELISVVRRVGRISRSGLITADMLPERLKSPKENPLVRKASIRPGGGNGDGKKTLLKLLNSCNGNKTAVARLLGISRNTLYKKLKRAGLDDLIG